ncbi:MAG: peptidoglycan DD-metalloendopeptidase family protein [Alphaproteobacteria bacterium]|nr:peptidoglycan DD-metalloendopeptidase family protein [Alphaproteobacteria bacterium]
MAQKLFLTCLLLIFAWTQPFMAASAGATTTSVSVADVAKAEAEAKRAQQERQKLEAEAKKIKEELSNVNQKMIAAAKKIQNGEDELQHQQDELDKLQAHLSESEAKFDVDHTMLLETLAALQNLAQRPSIAILAQPLSPVEVMRSSILLRNSVHALKERAEHIRQGIEDINSQKAEIAMRLKDLEHKNKALSEQHAEMKKLSQQKKQIFTKIESQSKEAKKKAETLASQAGSLRDLLDKLEKQKELQRRQLAEKERLARQRAADELRAERSQSPASIKAAMTNFAQAKGKIARPARGSIVTSFKQEMSKGVESNGIDIKTSSHAQVISPYEGTVIFSGPFKNFGNLIIIDHGQGYTSLLSGLEENNTEVGQTLVAGEPIGTMPAGGNNKLHMEIRKNNQPVNPVEWMTTK